MTCIRYSVLALLLLTGSSDALAQISIEKAYAEGQLGQTFSPVSVQATSGQTAAIQALAAQTGASQTWDFTALSYDAPAASPVSQEFIQLPDASLLGAGDPRIANANYAVRSIDPAKPDDVTIVYGSYDNDGHRTYGTMALVDGSTNDLLYDSGLFDYPFPLAYGATWTGSTSYVQSAGGFDTNVSITKDGDANGWGTLQTPQGTADALRYETTLTTTVSVFGFPTVTTSRLIFFVTLTGVSAGITITSTPQGDVITASFQYDGYGEGGGQPDPPATAPTGLSPATAATGVSTSPTLSWGAVTGATAYDLQVAVGSFTKSGSQAIVIDETGLTTTSFDATGLDFATEYMWRVRATNEGGAGAWTDAATFTTEAAPLVLPGAVSLTSPADLAADVTPITPTLSWSAAANAAAYDVQLATDAAFTLLILNETGVAGTSTQSPLLSYSTTYYWRVRGVNGDGNGDWTSASFTTAAEVVVVLPGTVTLTSPADAALDVAIDATLVWISAADASSYDVQVATDAAFTGTLVVDESGLTTTEQALTGLSLNTTYFWRVRGVNENGSGDWTTASFTTVTGVSTEHMDGAIPGSFNLGAAYPNPFNPQTTLSFDLPESSHVRLSVWDLSGRQVATLLSGPMAAGSYTHRWNAAHLKSGVYMIRLTAGAAMMTRTVTLLK